MTPATAPEQVAAAEAPLAVQPETRAAPVPAEDAEPLRPYGWRARLAHWLGQPAPRGERKTLILHAGFGKTGTTALQAFLALNRKVLAQHGISYPKAAFRGGAHHLIAPFVPPGVSARRWTPRRPRDWLPEVLATPHPRILMSTELLAAMGPEDVKRFCAAITPHVDLRVVLYLRRQDQMIMAGDNQQVKTGINGRPTAMGLSGKIARFDYLARLAPWEAAVGRDNMVVLPYERAQFVQGDLFADFLARALDIGSTDGFARPPATDPNPALAPDALELKRLVNALVGQPRRAQRIAGALQSYSAAQSGTVPHATLSPAQCRHVLETLAPSNAEVARRYLGRADGVLFTETPPAASPHSPDLHRPDLRRPWDWLARERPRTLRWLRGQISAGLTAPSALARQAAEALHTLDQGGTPELAITAPRRIVLHPGFPKTGTTAVQQALFKTRHRLLHDHRVLYPGIDENHTKPLLAMFRADARVNLRFEGMDPAELKAYAEKARWALESEILGQEWQTLVLSGEGLLSFSDKEWAAMVGWLGSLAPDAPVEIVVGIRDAAAWSASALQQTLKAGFPLDQLMAKPPRLTIRRKLEPLVAQFGAAAVTILDFDAAVNDGPGLLPAFVAATGMPNAVLPILSSVRTERNATFSQPAVEAIGAEIARQMEKDPTRKPLTQHQLHRFAQIKGPRFALPPEMRDSLRAEAAPDLVWLEQVFPDVEGPVRRLTRKAGTMDHPAHELPSLAAESRQA